MAGGEEFDLLGAGRSGLLVNCCAGGYQLNDIGRTKVPSSPTLPGLDPGCVGPAFLL